MRSQRDKRLRSQLCCSTRPMACQRWSALCWIPDQRSNRRKLLWALGITGTLLPSTLRRALLHLKRIFPCAQNNVDAADSAESEELLTDAPPWCYSESGAISDCSPIADRVVRAGVHELQVRHSRCTGLNNATDDRICSCNLAGVAASRSILLPVEAFQRLGLGGWFCG